MNLQELIRRVRDWVVALWQRTEKRDRRRFFVVSGVALAVIVVAVSLLNRTTWVPLASDLTPVQSQEIAQGLAAQGIPYRSSGGGSLIEVPERRRTEAAMYLQNNNIPSDGSSFELFQRGSGLVVSQYERERWFYYQLESDITRALLNMYNVRQAFVKLAIPESRPSIYAQTSEPKASVHIVTADGSTPGSDFALAIKANVAATVVDLSPDNVTVTCQNGYILDDTETVLSRANDRLALSRAIESEFERGVRALLDSVAGPDNYTVKSSVRLNFDSHIADKLTYEPVTDENGIIESIQELSEQARGAGVAVGEPGFDENGGGDTYDDVDGNNVDYWQKNVSTINYLVSQVVEHIEYEQGAIEELFFAIVLDSAVFTNDTATANMFRQIIGGAIGLPSSKYSNISVSVQTFTGKQQAADDYDEWQRQQRRAQIIALIRSVVLYLVIGACVILLILRTFKILHKEEPKPEVSPEDAEAAELAALAQLAGMAPEEEEMTLGETTKSPAREQIEKFIQKSPDAVANLLRNWLNEEQASKKK
ncbi:MAG: flagellar M-ring protein FliF [Oscillospiraceae bacterium]|nr:flagellar M-ring protein FliF [Oscillospiraceae bacterium]